MSSIYSSVYKELKAKIEHLPEYNTKIAKSVWYRLDEEAIHDIILDNGVFWFEHYQHGKGMDQKEYNFLIKYLKNKGYKYLYE